MYKISEQWIKDYDYLYYCDFTEDLEFNEIMHFSEDSQEESTERLY